MILLRLDEEQFRDLVRGGIVEIRPEVGEPIGIMLADIGFDRMWMALREANEDAQMLDYLNDRVRRIAKAAVSGDVE